MMCPVLLSPSSEAGCQEQGGQQQQETRGHQGGRAVAESGVTHAQGVPL